jgi:uncharacterized protein (DUF433 family)
MAQGQFGRPEAAIGVANTVCLTPSHIEATPGVCGGKPRIVGHRITVQNIVLWHERAGMSPEEIVARYPQLTMADVYAALTYYWDHRDEIRQQIRTDEAFADALRAAHPSRLEKKLRERRGDDSIAP